MSDCDNTIRCIFFSEFHPTAGPKIAFQVPDDYITKETFDAIHTYIITKLDLQDRLITVNALGYKILGYPVCISSAKYSRNLFIFNLCFVFDKSACTTNFEPVVKKLAAYLTQLEHESGYLSNDATRATIPKLMGEVQNKLNTDGLCNVPMSSSTTIHLKVAPSIAEPPPVADHDVPILVKDLVALTTPDWDLTTKQILPYLDGFNHVARIAADADVEINLVKACIQNLQHYGVVKLISIFQYSNVHATTPDICKLAQSKDLQDECINFVRRQGHSFPNFRDIFHLYCALTPGTTVRDICCRFNPRMLKIDERKLIQFGLMKGLIRRLHRYPIKLNTKSGPTKLHHLYAFFNGLHTLDEICCKTGMSHQDLDEKIENDPNVVVCWK